MIDSLARAFVLWGVAATVALGASPFAFRDAAGTSLAITEAGRPVLVYNYGMMRKEGVDPKFRRSSYIHPLYAPDGTLVTDDFPKDHPHHRGMCWSWPHVGFEGQMYDMWAVSDLQDQFVRWRARQAGESTARLAVENGWFIHGKKAVKETVELTVHKASGNRRAIDVTLRFEATGAPVSLTGREVKGYGGFGVRFAPRTETVLRTPAGIEAKDSDMKPNAWAELEANFDGHKAGLRLEEVSTNPGAPNGWCLRHYGYGGSAGMYTATGFRIRNALHPVHTTFKL